MLHKVITHVSRGECLIMGDFNHPDIRWNSLDSSNESAKFLLLVQNCFLTQHVLLKTGSRYSKQRKRDFKKGDYVQMRCYLENMKWAEILENKTA